MYALGLIHRTLGCLKWLGPTGGGTAGSILILDLSKIYFYSILKLWRTCVMGGCNFEDCFFYCSVQCFRGLFVGGDPR